MRNITTLNIYPVKSCQAQTLKEFNVLLEGPEGDRQWMVVDDNSEFLTQRKYPKLATIQVNWSDAGLSLGVGKQFFVVPRENKFLRKISATIWGSTVEVALEPDLVSQAVSQFLGISCRLVRSGPFTVRDPMVRFPDSLPVLLLNTKSLEDLNSRLEIPVGIDRFRGNIIFEGEAGYEEDTWNRIRIGEVTFSKPKKAGRCSIVTIDQKSGEARGPEPLKTLAGYRREGKQVNFGVLWVPENNGRVRAGDTVNVLS